MIQLAIQIWGCCGDFPEGIMVMFFMPQTWLDKNAPWSSMLFPRPPFSVGHLPSQLWLHKGRGSKSNSRLQEQLFVSIFLLAIDHHKYGGEVLLSFPETSWNPVGTWWGTWQLLFSSNPWDHLPRNLTSSGLADSFRCKISLQKSHISSDTVWWWLNMIIPPRMKPQIHSNPPNMNSTNEPNMNSGDPASHLQHSPGFPNCARSCEKLLGGFLGCHRATKRVPVGNGYSHRIHVWYIC